MDLFSGAPKKQTGTLLSPRHSLQEALEFAQKIKTKCKWTAARGVDVEKFLFVAYRCLVKETILFA